MKINESSLEGMKIIPNGEQKCIWMDAGVVSYKLCTNQFQCPTCDFDHAMSNRARAAKEMPKDERPALGQKGSKKEIVEWMEEFLNLPADQRKCRYMLMGEVSYKVCPNSFRCGECTYDQMMQDRVQPSFHLDIDKLPQVAGFYLDDRLSYFRNHTWLHLERNGQYRVGIDDFARRILGKAQHIKLPSPGKYLDLEEYSWSLRHLHGVLDMVSPVKGMVTTVNYAILEDTELLAEQPYGEGWLMTIEPENIRKSNRNFLTGSEAQTWMLEEANLLHKSLGSEAGVTMQDGASLVKDLSCHLSKEKWSEIARKHLLAR